MQTHQIHVSGADERIGQIRSELFAFPEVLEVFVTGRPDVLVVVYAGRPRPAEWLRVLRRRGYRTPARGHARWPRPDGPPEILLRYVVDCLRVGADSDDETLSSIRTEQAPRRRRDAA